MASSKQSALTNRQRNAACGSMMVPWKSCCKRSTVIIIVLRACSSRTPKLRIYAAGVRRRLTPSDGARGRGGHPAFPPRPMPPRGSSCDPQPLNPFRRKSTSAAEGSRSEESAVSARAGSKTPGLPSSSSVGRSQTSPLSAGWAGARGGVSRFIVVLPAGGRKSELIDNRIPGSVRYRTQLCRLMVSV
jgi:hypothetical protein